MVLLCGNCMCGDRSCCTALFAAPVAMSSGSGAAMADDSEGFGGEGLRPGALAQLEARVTAREVRLEAQETWMEALETQLKALEIRLEALETLQEAQGNVIALHTTLLTGIVGQDIKVVAGEILKWSVKKDE